MQKILHLIFTTITCLFFTSGTIAQTWDGGAGTTSWMDDANWSGDVLPTASSNVSIGNGYTVEVPSGTALAKIISNSGNLTIALGATLTVTDSNSGGHTFNNGSGSLTNHGTLNVSSGSVALSGLLLQAGVTFNNTGTININNIGRRGLTLTGGTSTNSGTINISNTGLNSSSLGDGIFFTAAGTFTNSGTIVIGPGITANGLLHNSSTVFENSGSITIAASSNGISAGGTFNNTGSGTVEFGTIGGTEISSNVIFNQASTGTVTTSGTINCAGTLKGGGSGNIGLFSNTNITAPGTSPGCLSFSSDYTTSGNLQIEINGATACTQYDRLNVTGTVTVSGTLTVNFGSFTPNNGQTFQIINAGGYAGSFSAINETPATIVASFANGVLTVESGGLPVELTAFSARLQNQLVQLTWQTASELNNAGFHIERSTDGRFWENIGFVAGNGTTTETHDYAFLDEKPLATGTLTGVNYYRLRQTDFDGGEEFSSVVAIDLLALEAGLDGLLAYPNPVSGGELTLLLPEHLHETTTVQLFDPAGRLALTASLGSGQQKLYVSGLAAGVYMLRAGGFFEKIVITN